MANRYNRPVYSRARQRSMDRKRFFIIGGAVAALVVIVVLALTLPRGRPRPRRGRMAPQPAGRAVDAGRGRAAGAPRLAHAHPRTHAPDAHAGAGDRGSPACGGAAHGHGGGLHARVLQGQHRGEDRRHHRGRLLPGGKPQADRGQGHRGGRQADHLPHRPEYGQAGPERDPQVRLGERL